MTISCSGAAVGEYFYHQRQMIWQRHHSVSVLSAVKTITSEPERCHLTTVCRAGEGQTGHLAAFPCGAEFWL